MKVIQTRSEKTLYDTNGKKVSVVRKEVVEIDTTPHILNREETVVVKECINNYKTSLKNAKRIKEDLEKTVGPKEGQKIFRDMADLVMIVQTPFKEKPNQLFVTGRVTSNHVIWEVANTHNDDFQQGLTKKKKK